MNEIETAWLAGLLEGEGCFGLYQKKSTTGESYPVFTCEIRMTDKDVLDKVVEITKLGKVGGPRVNNGLGHKPIFHWKLTKKSEVAFVLKAVLPLMCSRRSDKIKLILETMESSARPTWRHGTRQGYEYQGCRCDLCRESNNARHRQRRKEKKEVNYE